MGHTPTITPRRSATPRAIPTTPGSMNALEILRETARILRSNPSPFTATLALLILPVSALLLSGALVPPSLLRTLSRRLTLLAITSGLPPTRFLAQISAHLASSLLSAAASFPLLLTLLLLARAAIAYSVACAYAARPALPRDFLAALLPACRRLLATYLSTCLAASLCLALFLLLLLLACSAFSALGYPPNIVLVPAVLVLLLFSVVYAHTIIVCNLAIVIAVLEEEVGGPQALLRSVRLIKGQTQTGLLIFLGSTVGMAFVEGLFEHRVKTVSYGDGSSRLWEGPLLIVMYSFVVLIDFMMSAVFYFTCRSSSMDVLNGNNGHALEDVEKLSLMDSE